MGRGVTRSAPGATDGPSLPAASDHAWTHTGNRSKLSPHRLRSLLCDRRPVVAIGRSGALQQRCAAVFSVAAEKSLHVKMGLRGKTGSQGDRASVGWD